MPYWARSALYTAAPIHLNGKSVEINGQSIRTKLADETHQIPLDLLIDCDSRYTRIFCTTSSTRFCWEKLDDGLSGRRVKTGDIVEIIAAFLPHFAACCRSHPI